MYAVANVVTLFYSLCNFIGSMTLNATLKENNMHLQFDFRLPRPGKKNPARYNPLFYK